MAILRAPLFFGSHRLEMAAANAPALKRGDPNINAVQRVQAALLELGYPLPRSCRRGLPDGIFGGETYNAIIAFQKASFPFNPTEWDGAAGRNTLGRMDELLLADTAGFNPGLDVLDPMFGVPAPLCLPRRPGSGGNVFAANDFLEPHGPTVVCDGNGGYKVDLQGTEGFVIAPCVKAHEESHIEDLKKICPDGCKGQKNGTPHPTDGSRCPAFKNPADYDEWARQSECKAHKVSLACLRTLLTKTTDNLQRALIKGAIKSAKRSLKYHKCED